MIELAHLVYQHWFITCILMVTGAVSFAISFPTIKWKRTYHKPTGTPTTTREPR